MGWDRILQNDVPGGSLLRRIGALFDQQRASWPALCEGEAALAQLQTKSLRQQGEQIVVQWNPARRRSTHAKVDPQSLAARPCFLCPQNMPPEERGVAFEELVILPNPYPILPLHCTVADRQHRPQRLGGRISTLLRLAKAIGPPLAAFYNGPRCGASAPDHFHFQACSAAEIPILGQLPALSDDCRPVVHLSFGRSMVYFAGRAADELVASVEQVIEMLGSLDHQQRGSGDEPPPPEGAATGMAMNDEPMVNLLAHHHGDRYLILIFPRRAHRPARYYAEGAEHLAISPAILEMCGVLVTPDADQFARIDAATAQSIYQEVSLEPALIEPLLTRRGDTHAAKH